MSWMAAFAIALSAAASDILLSTRQNHMLGGQPASASSISTVLGLVQTTSPTRTTLFSQRSPCATALPFVTVFFDAGSSSNKLIYLRLLLSTLSDYAVSTATTTIPC